jgi:hypothetical protein
MTRLTTMTDEQIRELITRRRAQILVHSIIYYELDDCIISDHQWQDWADELAELQNLYPDIAAECHYADAFASFDGSSGFNLPLRDSWGVRKARYLIDLCNRLKGENT